MTRTTATLLLFVLLLTACGGDPAADVDVPSWARVAPEQIAEASTYGVPVAFENNLGMRFVLIPAGTFRMGSPEDEEGRLDDETQHEVTISKPYYLSICEVTMGQYRALDPDHPSTSFYAADADGAARGDADVQPMVEVSWDGASGFAERLSVQPDSRTYRLPTEAEWEHACRAGTTTPFWWGRSAAADKANYKSDAAFVHKPGGSAHPGTMPVGTLQANPWGLYDLHGNVAEWCADWYAPYADGAVSDPHGPLKPHAPLVTTWVRTGEDATQHWTRVRTQRGGGWSQLPRFCRSAARLRSVPGDCQDYVGFRLVSPLTGGL